MEQLKMFEFEFFQLTNMDLMKILNYSGCLLPCEYTEYQIVDTPITLGKTNSSMWLILASTTVIVKTEELLYPFTSFLAEFGGALGLFLGFKKLFLRVVLC